VKPKFGSRQPRRRAPGRVRPPRHRRQSPPLHPKRLRRRARAGQGPGISEEKTRPMVFQAGTPIVAFVRANPGKIGTREIAREFGLKNAEPLSKLKGASCAKLADDGTRRPNAGGRSTRPAAPAAHRGRRYHRAATPTANCWPLPPNGIRKGKTAPRQKIRISTCPRRPQGREPPARRRRNPRR